jgi:hypothetical protein
MPESGGIRIKEIKPDKEEANIIYNGHDVRQVEILTNDICRVFIGTAVSGDFLSELYYVNESTKKMDIRHENRDLIPRWHLNGPVDKVNVNHLPAEGISIKHIMTPEKRPDTEVLVRELFIPFTMIRYVLTHRHGHLFWERT